MIQWEKIPWDKILPSLIALLKRWFVPQSKTGKQIQSEAEDAIQKGVGSGDTAAADAITNELPKPPTD